MTEWQRLRTERALLWADLLEKVFFGVAIAFFTTGLMGLLNPSVDSPSSEASDPLAAVVQNLVYLGVIAWAVLRRAFARDLLNDPLVWLLVVWAVVSTGWSEVPELTSRRSLVMVATTFTGVYFASRFRLEEQLSIVSASLFAMMAASALFALLLPEYGLLNTNPVGAWRGVFPQKNVLGRMAVLALLVHILRLASAQRHRWLHLVPPLLALVVIVQSRSQGAVVITLALLFTLLLMVTLRIRGPLVVPSVIGLSLAAMACAAFLAANSATAFRLLGKDETLTGRTAIWLSSLSSAAERPIAGYGFHAFWSDRVALSQWIQRVVGWETPHSHSGFLDILLELGAVGLLVWVASWTIAGARAVRTARLIPTAAGIWPAMYLVFLLLWNVSETTIPRQNSIFWMLYVAASFSVARIVRAQRVALRDDQDSARALPARRVRSSSAPTAVV